MDVKSWLVATALTISLGPEYIRCEVTLGAEVSLGRRLLEVVRPRLALTR